jgi:hypothetical protein
MMIEDRGTMQLKLSKIFAKDLANRAFHFLASRRFFSGHLSKRIVDTLEQAILRRRQNRREISGLKSSAQLTELFKFCLPSGHLNKVVT